MAPQMSKAVAAAAVAGTAFVALPGKAPATRGNAPALRGRQANAHASGMLSTVGRRFDDNVSYI